MRSSTARLLAILIALALAVAACGNDDDSQDSADSPPEPTAAPAEEPEEAPAEEPTAAPAEEPEEVPAPDPVKIGLIAQEEELLAFPEVRAASQAFVDYFNAELDGANGTPIELVVCGAGDTPESHVACAQQFVNDDDIKIAVSAGFGPNSAAASATMTEGGVPTITLGNDFVDYLTPGAYNFDPGLPGLAQVFFVYASQVRGDTTGTLFIADDPAFEPFIPALQAISEANGIALNEVVPLGFEPDLTGPVSAANPDNDMWFFLLADGAQCTASAAAVETVGFDGNLYANDLCMSEDVVGTGALDGWIGAIVSSAPTADGGEDVALINRVLDQYGSDDAQNAGLSGWALANMYVARDALIEAGLADATREGVLESLSTYSSSDIPGLSGVSCPGPSYWIGACNMAPLVVTVADGLLTSPDGFIQLDFSELDFLLEG